MNNKEDLDWETWWDAVIALAYTTKIVHCMIRCESIYKEYYEKGLSPEKAFEEEWG